MNTMRTEDDHMEQEDNPFGLDDETPGELRTGNFQDVPLDGAAGKDTPDEVEDVEQANNQSDEDNFSDWEMIEYEEAVLSLSASKRPPDFMNDPFKDKWRNTVDAYTQRSQYGKRRTFALKPMMVKANDDCRQEVMALQLVKRLKQLFTKTNQKLYLRPYEILITSSSSAMIEFMPDTISINALKKKML